jgi:epoxyqueuosine reductase
MLTSPRVKAEAMRLGFVACGVTTLEPLPHGLELEQWLRVGYAGTMRYLHRQARKRIHPQLADRDARRAVVVLDNYYPDHGQAVAGDSGTAARGRDGAAQPGRSPTPSIARYARGEDYHLVTLRRLEVLAGFLRENGATAARAYVDTGPIAERELAQRAGLGWIGKNTMLIRPGLGSWFFIGEVLTDLALEIDAPFATDHCGTCTRCLEACPTGAFVGPRVLDARRCISYVTIEQKGDIPGPVAERLSGWAFGCDICNEVCPWNERFATITGQPEFLPRQELAQAGETFFAQMGDAEFERRFGDTALARTGLGGMRRNWAAAWRSLPHCPPPARG